MPFRLLDPTEPAFGLQVDAVLWLGPDETLTESLPDAALYRSGAYADELRRRSEILTEITGQHVDLVAEGLQLAAGGRQALGETSAQDKPHD